MKFTKKKAIVTIVVVLVAAVAVKTVVFSKNNQPTQGIVSTTQVVKEDLKDTIRLSAVLEGTDSTDVVSNLHYEVKQVLVQEGDRVKKGQLLAVLDSSDISDKLQSANGSVRLLELQQAETLENRQNEYETAQAAYDAAKKTYEDQKALLDAGAASQSEVDEAERAMEAAQRTLEAIPAQNGKAVYSEAEKQSLANAKLDASLQAKQLEDCSIISPIDGTVTRVNTKVGRFADDTESKTPMFVIENIDALQMKVLVNEADIGKVEVGQQVTVSADILEGEEVQAVVSRISPTGEEKSGGNGGRVIPVYISLTEQNEKLIAGITAKATILVEEQKDALTVPVEALYRLEDGTDVVYTVTEQNTVHIVPVKTGVENDLYVAITGEGITEGSLVVLNPSATLTEGATVAVQ